MTVVSACKYCSEPCAWARPTTTADWAQKEGKEGAARLVGLVPGGHGCRSWSRSDVSTQWPSSTAQPLQRFPDFLLAPAFANWNDSLQSQQGLVITLMCHYAPLNMLCCVAVLLQYLVYTVLGQYLGTMHCKYRCSVRLCWPQQKGRGKWRQPYPSSDGTDFLPERAQGGKGAAGETTAWVSYQNTSFSSIYRTFLRFSGLAGRVTVTEPWLSELKVAFLVWGIHLNIISISLPPHTMGIFAGNDI